MRLRNIVPAIVIVAAAGVASAQETYSVAATVGQTADLRQYVLSQNRRTCQRQLLAVTCTQAQACTSANVAGGVSCTNAAARAANVRIWPDTLAGREEFVVFFWLAPLFGQAKATLPTLAAPDYCIWWTAQNQTTRDAECTKIGAPTGCSICP